MKSFFNPPHSTFHFNSAFLILSLFGAFLFSCDTSGNDPLPEDPLEETDPNEFIPLHRMDILDNGTNGKSFEVKFYPIDDKTYKPKTFLSSNEGPYKILIKNRDTLEFGDAYIGTQTDGYRFNSDTILIVDKNNAAIASYVGTDDPSNASRGFNVTKTPDAIQKMLQFKYSKIN